MGKSVAWKALERKAAKLLKGNRVLELGSDSEDVNTEQFVGECKYGKQVPTTIYRWYEQACKYRLRKGNQNKTPILVAQRPGRKITLVIIDINHFNKLITEKRDAEEKEKTEA